MPLPPNITWSCKMAWNDECQYCRSNCNGGCNGAYKSAIESAIAPYKQFKETWQPLIDLIENCLADPYYKAGENPNWSAVLVKFKEIRKAERDKVLATLTEEQRKILGV